MDKPGIKRYYNKLRKSSIFDDHPPLVETPVKGKRKLDLEKPKMSKIISYKFAPTFREKTVSSKPNQLSYKEIAAARKKCQEIQSEYLTSKRKN